MLPNINPNLPENQDDFLAQIDDVLNIICEKLQLTETQRLRVESAYNSVGDWLEKDIFFFNAGAKVEVYPHGSFRIQTTVKPYSKNEYDLDFIAYIHMNWQYHNPITILNEIERSLRSNGNFASKVERKNRCVRLNYDTFHMDIQPGFPAQMQPVENKYLKVPDRKQFSWMDSAPKVFADDWFDKVSKLSEIAKQNRKTRFTKSFSRQVEARENLPMVEPFHLKSPLKRAVQLMKRYRDIYFDENPRKAAYKTSSIILTTLAGDLYQGEDSEYLIIKNTLARILEKLHKEGINFTVNNPIQPKECFTEKWKNDSGYVLTFYEFITTFKEQWDNIDSAIGLLGNSARLKTVLGKGIVNEAFTEQTKRLTKLRKENELYMERSSGILGATAKKDSNKIERNNFYGD